MNLDVYGYGELAIIDNIISTFLELIFFTAISIGVSILSFGTIV